LPQFSGYGDGAGNNIGVAAGQFQAPSAAVPEPSSLIAAAGGCGTLALLGYFARRRRHRAPLACA
jgi:hypothetical protein